jgi:hypothetical protein
VRPALRLPFGGSATIPLAETQTNKLK